MNQTCPACDGSSILREVIYGLPDGPTNENKCLTSGCSVLESDPMIRCVNCGWEGDFVNHLKTLGSTDVSI